MWTKPRQGTKANMVHFRAEPSADIAVVLYFCCPPVRKATFRALGRFVRIPARVMAGNCISHRRDCRFSEINWRTSIPWRHCSSPSKRSLRIYNPTKWTRAGCWRENWVWCPPFTNSAWSATPPRHQANSTISARRRKSALALSLVYQL